MQQFNTKEYGNRNKNYKRFNNRDIHKWGGNTWITQSAPTNFHQFYKRKMLTVSENISDYKEVTEAEKTALESADAKWERPPQSFIDRCNTMCGQDGGYNDRTGYFELNGLTDINYEQMIPIMEAGSFTPADLSSAWAFVNNLRTLVTRRIRDVKGTFMCQRSKIEVLRFTDGLFSSLTRAFSDCSMLKSVRIIRYNTSAEHAFDGCPLLEDLQLFGLNGNLYLGDSPLLSLESFRYIVNRSGTGQKTVTVHPDVMAKLSTPDIVTDKAMIRVYKRDSYTKAQWQLMGTLTNDSWMRYGHALEIEINVGDIMVVTGTPSDDASVHATYYGEVVAVDDDSITTNGIKTVFNSWPQLLLDAAEKNITFASA